MAEAAKTLDELDELLRAIETYEDPRRASSEWKQVFRLLGKTSLGPRDFQAVVGMRDVAGLKALLESLRRPDEAAAEAGAETIDPDTLKRAYRAFRKRVKFTRLDDESALGRGPLSKGANERLGAITPPTEWPEPVWRELVRQGKLRYLGDGLYEIAKS